ncbi:nucleolar protein dao-5-like [Frankliniella occidentalis]|uniref:Nucleolar protein dao-5-like n=1 Tax=Frankliniella occidentalis TaxID=133901 RepID=A0A9C6X885_FRAOC|nr:nucleolar protein dao-5-like [Frankliniella occidentalis]
MPSGFRARINAHPLENPHDNDFGYDGINANRAFQARGESTQFRQAQENDGFRTRQHPYDFGGRTARVVNIVEAPESTQPLAIGWMQDATRPTTNPEPLRRSARRAAAAAAAASSKEADVERGQSSEGSSRGNRAQRQGHNFVAEQQGHSDDDAQPINSRENNNSDSDSSQRDDLGRWMDGGDDVSSDFEPKVKISKANQQKKVHALKKKKNNAHQFNSDDEAGPSKRPTTAGRGRSDSDSDFETEARKQQQRAPSKSKPKSLTLKTKASGEVKRKGKQQQQQQQQAEPKFTAGALYEADHGAISNGQQSEAITISDSEGSVGHPAAELFPIEAELLTDDFNIPSDSLSESIVHA